MARFRVLKIIPARYVEEYLVDAGFSEEAQRAVVSGRARCTLRHFMTTQGVDIPSPRFVVLDEHADVSEHLPDVEIPNEKLPTAFNNASFSSIPGDSEQFAFQEVDQD